MLLADGQRDLISALVTMAVAIAIAFAVDRLVIARAGRVASGLRGPTLSRAAQTRLRLVRRLVFVVILADRRGAGAQQVHQVLSGSPPASWPRARCSGSSIGFAARQTLANMVAGILLAITQPIRIGDTVTMADEHRPRRRPHALLHLHRHRATAA